MIVPLVTIPITLEYLGADRFGLWMTISSLLSMMVFADLGIGNGLLTEIGKLDDKRDSQEFANLISTSYAVLTAGAALLLIGLWSLAPMIPWSWLVHTSDTALVADTKHVGLICATCFILGIPLNLIAKIQLGLQRGYVNELWVAASSLSTMCCTLLAVQFRAPLPILVLTVAAPPLLFMLVNTYTFFRSHASRGDGCVGRFNVAVAKSIIRIGGSFFALSLLTTATLNCDNLIVSRLWGLQQVTELEVASKPFKLVLMFVSLLCMPVWPAYAQALARGEYSWIRSITRRLVAISAFTAVAMAIGVFFASPALFRLWIGPSFQVDPFLMGTLALWTVLPAIAAPYFMLLNGSGNVFVQIKMWAWFLPIAVGCKTWFGQLWGVAGIPLGASIPYLIIVIPWSMFGYSQVRRRSASS